MDTITFIGNGNMALSIAKGLKERYNIEVIGRNMSKINHFEEELGTNINKGLINHFDITGKTVLLCVKPANVEEVGKQLKGQARIIFSVLAGTKIEKLKNNFNNASIVRTMPNVASSYGKSMTTLTGDRIFKEEAESLLGSIGETLWLERENDIDIATALAGSGPAYLAIIAKALTQGAVDLGLSKEDATTLTNGLFDGFAAVIQDNDPDTLKKSVMSPGGTTEAGCQSLDKSGIEESIKEALTQAYKRALTL